VPRKKGLKAVNMTKGNAKTKSLVVLGILILLGLLGCVMVSYSTRWGPYLNGDSIVYIQGAKNLLAGNGYATLLGGGEIQRITGFPPMTSVMLAATNLGLGDMVSTGRWLNILLLGLNVVLAGWIVFRYSRSPAAAAFAGAMVVTQVSVILAYASVMSEGLFITFMLLTLWTLAEFLEKDRPWLLVVSGLLAALSMLTRYVGIVLVPVAGLALLFFGEKRFRIRLRDILIFGAASMVPVALWLLKNQLAGTDAVDRQIGLHLMSQAMRGELVDQVMSWFYLTKLGLPWRVRVPLFILLYLAVVGWFALKDKWFLRRKEAEAQPLRALPYMLAVFLPLYMLTIWANTSILDPNTSFGAIQRYLTPSFVSTAILIACVVWRLATGVRRQALAVAVSVLLGVGLTGYYASNTEAYILRTGDETGYGYTDNINYWPDEIAALKALSPDRPIVTNDSQLLYALCERYSYPLPYTTSDDGSRGVDASALRAQLAEGDYLVIITRTGVPLADVFDEMIVADYPAPVHVGYIFIYSDPVYAP
jgi:hypothetical protein